MKHKETGGGRCNEQGENKIKITGRGRSWRKIERFILEIAIDDKTVNRLSFN